jgi:MFS family permease
MIQLLSKYKDIRYLVISYFISETGSWFSYMLLIVLSYTKTGDMLHTMVIVAAQSIAAIIAGQLSGVFVEKRTPKYILLFSDMFSVIIIGALFFFSANLWLYASVGFLIAFINGFREPTFHKYLVASVEEESLMSANATFQMIREFVKIFGPTLAVSVLAALPGHYKGVGFLIDACSYFIAALLLTGLNRFKEVQEETKTDENSPSLLVRWKEGITPLKDPVVLNVFIMLLLILMCIAGADVLFTAHIVESHLNSYSVGYVVGALSLGILLTSMLGSKIIKTLPLTFQLGGAGAFIGLFYGGIGWSSNLLIMIICGFLLGIFNAIYNMTSSTFWQKVVPYEKLARFFGFATSIFSIVTLIGMGLNGWIGSLTNSGFIISLCGALLFVVGLLSMFNISWAQKRKLRLKKENGELNHEVSS